MAFGRQGLADHRLQGRVSGPLHLESAQVVDEFGDDEGGGDVATRDLLGLLNVTGKPAASFPRATPLPRIPASTTTERRAKWKPPASE